MTQPGSVVPPRPSWWVRTARIGTATGRYGWVITRKTFGHTAAGYRFTGAAYSTGGDQFPYVFPFTVDGTTITAAGHNTLEAGVNALGSGDTTIPKAVQTSAASTLTLTSAHNVFVYTGSTTATWTLPPVSGATLTLWCFNRGAATVTVQRAGADQIFNHTLATSISMTAGAAARFVNDGTYWLAF